MQETTFTSTHNLPFMSAEWNSPLIKLLGINEGWMLFKIGTCEGQWRVVEDSYQILSVVNDTPGNGHLDDVFEWFENSCKRDGKHLEVLEFFNNKFKDHLLNKRGFKWIVDTEVGIEYARKDISLINTPHANR